MKFLIFFFMTSCATSNSISNFGAPLPHAIRVVGVLNADEKQATALGALYRSIVRHQWSCKRNCDPIQFVLLASNEVSIDNWLKAQTMALYGEDKKAEYLHIIDLGESTKHGAALPNLSVVLTDPKGDAVIGDLTQTFGEPHYSVSQIAKKLGIPHQFIGSADETGDTLGTDIIAGKDFTILGQRKRTPKLQNALEVPVSMYYLGAMTDLIKILPSDKACGQILAISNPILGLHILTENPASVSKIAKEMSADKLASSLNWFRRDASPKDTIRIQDFNMRRSSRRNQNQEWTSDEWVFLNLRVALDTEKMKNRVLHELKKRGQCVDGIVDFPVVYRQDEDTGEARLATPTYTSGLLAGLKFFVPEMPSHLTEYKGLNFLDWSKSVTREFLEVEWHIVPTDQSLTSLVWVLPKQK